ncbi:hypothetical protein ACF1CG_10220 [Streptomyces sp. NPDC014773]|uniref:hypothetical protein n=1 Tax=Streptomyces sp. NPDC014773 TaxID=3364908 RepID=UPI0036F55214
MTEATEATEATETDVTEDGGVTRVTVAGLTAPEPVPAGSASEESASEEPASKAPSGEGVPEAESEEAVAEVVEIPRQQSAGTAADADSETGGTARR